VNLLEASAQFPTVVFTIGLGVAVIYWIFVLIGALDIDMFGDGADVGGAAKGVGDAITGGAKGGAEGLKGLKFDADGDAGSGGLWAGLGLSKVPITISLSVIFLICWLLSLAAMHYLPSWLGTAAWVSAMVLPAALIVGLPISGVLVRPLGHVFELKEGKHNRDYVGHTCTITTGNVDNGFGQATIEDGGTVLVIPVRCDRSDVLARGDKALIIDFDTVRQAYVVEPAADMIPDARKSDGESDPGATS
jgi:hypothetical protein